MTLGPTQCLIPVVDVTANISADLILTTAGKSRVRAKKSVKEEDESTAIAPVKKSRAKKGVKKEESVDSPPASDGKKPTHFESLC